MPKNISWDTRMSNYLLVFAAVIAVSILLLYFMESKKENRDKPPVRRVSTPSRQEKPKKQRREPAQEPQPVDLEGVDGGGKLGLGIDVEYQTLG